VRELKEIVIRVKAKSRIFCTIVCLFAFVLAAGCDDGPPSEEEQLRIANEILRERKGMEDEGPRVPERVLDTLRVMKERYKITRDEYWLNKGGVLTNEYFDVWYPPGPVTVTHGMHTFSQLEFARVYFDRFFSRSVDSRLTVICAMDMTDYTDRTGNQWWTYATIDDDELVFQPIDVLWQRDLLDMAVRREYYVWGIGKLTGGRAPRWFTHGLASMMSEEDEVLQGFLFEYKDDDLEFELDDVESGLKNDKDRKPYRLGRYAAFRMVRRLSAAHGQEKMSEVVERLGEGQKHKKAFEATFGQSYDELVAFALDFKVNE
jgi:hypothetical protein